MSDGQHIEVSYQEDGITIEITGAEEACGATGPTTGKTSSSSSVILKIVL
ncbi:MAG TPA: hypothetical protein VGD91_23165 [Trebonia sp.]